MENRWIAPVLGALLLLSGVPHRADAQDDDVVVVADFDGGNTSGRIAPVDTEAELVSAGTGKALQWRQAPSEKGGWVAIYGLPEDVGPFRRLRFRARCIGAYHDEAVVRIRSENGSLGADIQGLTEAWKTLEFLLPEMDEQEPFDPEHVARITLVCWETKGFTLEIDDIELVREGGGWRYSKEEQQARGMDLDAPVYRVDDFEDDTHLKRFEIEGCKLEAAEGTRRGDTRHAHWTVPRGAKTAWFTTPNLPKDIREYRVLRLRLRTMDPIADPITVRIRGGKGYLSRTLTDLKRKVWNEIVIPLPTMTDEEEFDPQEIWGLRLVVWNSQGFELDIDDIELQKGAGGWKMSPEQRLAWLFGEKRAKKVDESDTKHFRVFTDSSAAKKKFPRALEKIYDFVLKTLGLDGFGENDKLDVFIFQNPELYFDFCVRRGWSREAAERTAGHAWGGFFATYYQSPSAATVVHELTHSLFHRCRGPGGGSWFQEGAAVCVEERWQKRDAATVFAPRLRGGQFMHLTEFLTTDELIASHDVRGGAGTADDLYLQAGAFFEFLMRGPFAALHPDALQRLAGLDWEADTVVKELEAVYGTSLAEIETAWVEWGSDPPKPH